MTGESMIAEEARLLLRLVTPEDHASRASAEVRVAIANQPEKSE